MPRSEIDFAPRAPSPVESSLRVWFVKNCKHHPPPQSFHGALFRKQTVWDSKVVLGVAYSKYLSNLCLWREIIRFIGSVWQIHSKLSFLKYDTDMVRKGIYANDRWRCLLPWCNREQALDIQGTYVQRNLLLPSRTKGLLSIPLVKKTQPLKQSNLKQNDVIVSFSCHIIAMIRTVKLLLLVSFATVRSRAATSFCRSPGLLPRPKRSAASSRLNICAPTASRAESLWCFF